MVVENEIRNKQNLKRKDEGKKCIKSNTNGNQEF